MTDLAKLVVRLEAETARYVTELNKAQKKLADLSDSEREAQAAEEKRANAMERGAKVFAATRAPIEKYSSDIERLNELLAQGAIDQETFSRASASAKADLDKTNESLAEGKAIFEKTRTPIEAYAVEVDKLNKLLAQGAIDQETYTRAVASAKSTLDASNASLAEGRAIFEQTRTPVEKYTTEIDRLNGLAKSGAISQDTFNRAVKQSKKELEDGERAARKSSESYQLMAKAAKAVAVVALAAAVGIVATVKSSIDAADAMSKLAQKTGVSTTTLSGLAYAAHLSDISVDELSGTLKKLANTTIDAQKKGSAAADAFKAIGVSTRDASGAIKSQDDLLLDIADAFSRYEDGAAKSAIAQDIFSKGGDKLIPFLNQGRAGIEALIAELNKFGGTITDDVGRQAEEFNDNLTKLKASASGIGLAIASDLLPSLVSLSHELAESSKNSELFQRAAETIGTIARGLATFVLGTATSLIKLGNAIGATAAAATQAAKGNFKEAQEIWKQATADNLAIEADYQRQRAAIWKQGGDDVLEEVKITVKKIRDTIKIGNAGGDLNLEVKITAKKIEDNPVEALDKEIRQMTKTQEELALESYFKQKEALDLVWKEGGIKNIEAYNDRLQEIQDELLPTFEVTANRIKETTKKASSELNEFEKEAARNTQDIIATGLETALDEGASKGAKSALKAFEDMIEKMILQALAANVSQYLFGKPGESGDTGGVIGSIIDIFASTASGSAGTRDSGGRGRKGQAYKIGIGAQPETFVPDEDGTFYPRNQMQMAGGAAGVTQNIYVQGRPDPRTARQMQIEAQRQQRAASSRLG